MVGDGLVVLIATYNGERFLGKQFKSLLQQDVEKFSVVVRDDGSTDGTVDVIADYCMRFPERFTQVKDSLGNLGSSQCFMKLLEYAEAYRYVMFCDQDDVWLPSKVSSSVKAIKGLEEKHGNDMPLMHFTDLKVVDEKLNEISPSFWRSQRLDPTITNDWEKVLAQNVVTGCTMILNQRAREVCLPFKLPEMVHDQWIAVNVAKYGMASFSSEPTILYRQHSTNVVGAHVNIPKYLFLKFKDIVNIIFFYRRATACFGDVSVLKLAVHKLVISLRRFF